MTKRESDVYVESRTSTKWYDLDIIRTIIKCFKACCTRLLTSRVSRPCTRKPDANRNFTAHLGINTQNCVKLFQSAVRQSPKCTLILDSFKRYKKIEKKKKIISRVKLRCAIFTSICVQRGNYINRKITCMMMIT